MSELEDLKRKRLAELQQRLQDQEQREQEEFQRQMLVQKLLDPKALERLGNIRAANPLQAEKIEAMLAYLYQTGQLKQQINEELFKQILTKLSAKRETKIVRK